MDDPGTITIITEADILEGVAVCCDVTCPCEVVYGAPATEDQEQRLWLWIASEASRGRA